MAKNKYKIGCVTYICEDKTEIDNTVRHFNSEGYYGLDLKKIRRPEV